MFSINHLLFPLKDLIEPNYHNCLIRFLFSFLLRHKQRSSGGHAAAAGSVSCQRPQQSLHGPTGAGGCLNKKVACIRLKPCLGKVCVRMLSDSRLLVPSQGLTHLGKGTLTLCPYHSDRQLMSQVAVAGLLTVLVSFLDVKNSAFIFPSRSSIYYCPVGNRLHSEASVCSCCSNPGQVSLHPVQSGSSHAAADAGHVRRGAPTAARVR